MEKPIEITVGGAGPYDPIAGVTDCLIPTKKGMDLLIERRSTSPARIGFLRSAQYSILTAGGFRLLGGDTMQAGDTLAVFDAGVHYATGSTDYTNGFNQARVMGAMIGRLGWQQGTIADSPVANALNATSRSGRYFNQFHPLCTLSIVKRVLEDPNATDEQINAFLESLQRAAILRSLNGVLNGPEYLEQRLDFDRQREQTDRPITPAGLFAHRRIRPAALVDVAVQIDSVSLYFDGDITFSLYLFQEGRKAPIWTGNVDAIANEKTLVELPDIILSYLGGNSMGGAYYFGYFQDDLGAVKAIDESRCGFNVANNWCLENMESVKIVGQTDFNRRYISGSPWSHGLNLKLNAFRDWTTYVVQRAALFDELIGLQMAVMIIELALNNVRSNATERILKDQLQAMGLWQQLDGVSPGTPEAPKITSLKDLVNRETARVKKSFIPNHRGINYSTHGCID